MIDFSKPLQIAQEHRNHEAEVVTLIGHFNERALIGVTDLVTGAKSLFAVNDEGRSYLLTPGYRDTAEYPIESNGPRFENKPTTRTTVQYCHVHKDGRLGPSRASFSLAKAFFDRDRHRFIGIMRKETTVDIATGKPVRLEATLCENV